MQKVLVITYYWPPSGGPGVQRWLKFCKYLPEYGIQPIVITVNPNKASYPKTDTALSIEIPDNLEVHYTNTREPYQWYMKLTGKKEIPYSGFVNEQKPSFFQKAMRYIRGNLFIPDSRKGWNRYAFRKAMELIEREKIQTVITTSPPHSSQLIGLKLKQKTGIRWIADIRDPWTDIYYYKDMLHTRWAARRDAHYERTVLQSADSVVVVSEDIKRLFISKSDKIDPNKIHVIPNGYDEADFTAYLEPRTDGNFVVAYTGTLAESYAPQGFIRAFSKVREKYSKLKFVAAGKISESVAASFQAESFDYKGYLSHLESISLIRNADVLFLAIPQVANNKGILTGKLFEYLATKKPIIAVGPVDGDAATILRQCGAGRMFDWDDEDGIAQELERLMQAPAFNGTGAENYSRKTLSKSMVQVIGNK